MPFLYFLEDLRNPVLDVLFSLITLLGEETLFMTVGLIIFWCVDKYKGYYLLFVGFLGMVANQFLKMLCRVPRPWVKDPDFTIVESAREAATGYSFPSGHTQISVGLYGGIALQTKRKLLRIGALAAAVLIPFSRMYLGVHTPEDVLVSVVIAIVLAFAFRPWVEKGKAFPKHMVGILLFFVVVTVCYLCFVYYYPFPEDVDAQNLLSARENGFTLLGCTLGVVLTYVVDRKWTHFDTKAVWWAQVLKVMGGLLLILAVKELSRGPLDLLFAGHMAGRSVRYFLIVAFGGTLWPMTFRYFAKLGKRS